MLLYLSQFCRDIVLEVLGGFGPSLLVAAFEATDELLQHRRRAGHGGSSHSRIPLPTGEPIQREAAPFQSPLHLNIVRTCVLHLYAAPRVIPYAVLAKLLGDQVRKWHALQN